MEAGDNDRYQIPCKPSGTQKETAMCGTYGEVFFRGDPLSSDPDPLPIHSLSTVDQKHIYEILQLR